MPRPLSTAAETRKPPTEDLLSSGSFFPLLLAVSLVPYLWIPLSWDWFPEAQGRPMATIILLFIASQAHVGASFYFYTDGDNIGIYERRIEGSYQFKNAVCQMF